MVKCVDIIKQYQIPLFFKDQIQNIHYEDKIEVVTSLAETVFHFIKEDESSKYYLSIKNENNDLELTDKNGIILINNPCRLILENKLFPIQWKLPEDSIDENYDKPSLIEFVNYLTSKNFYTDFD